MSVSWYMRNLENVVIQYLNALGIESNQKSGLTGVWINDEKITITYPCLSNGSCDLQDSEYICRNT